jgi:hypothetical protein
MRFSYSVLVQHIIKKVICFFVDKLVHLPHGCIFFYFINGAHEIFFTVVRSTIL